jgi:hypothetical protein
MSLIGHILRLGHIPVFAGNSSQRTFIEKTFPYIEFIHLDGYNITYSSCNKFAQMGLLCQLPRLLHLIKRENTWLQRESGKLKLDGILSDNRYGLYHTRLPSIMLTHQPQVLTGMGRISDNAVRKAHYNFLGAFNQTWIVDVQDKDNLAGTLSHPKALPENARYIGWLSQFEDNSPGNSNDILLVLLSGPEPARTTLADKLWRQVQNYEGKVMFVAGTDEAPSPSIIPSHIIFHKRLSGPELAPIIATAGMVVCRSGYSTIMDLVALRKKAILIPTPGQTEQQYLANTLKEKGMFYSTAQKNFDLHHALNDASRFPFHQPVTPDTFRNYQPVLADWINTL